MSMIKCDRCDLMIDSDVDVDCFVDIPPQGNRAMPFTLAGRRVVRHEVVCESCRVREQDLKEREL